MPLDLFFVWIDSLYMSCNLRLLSNYHKKPMHTVEPYIARVYSNTTQDTFITSTNCLDGAFIILLLLSSPFISMLDFLQHNTM